jgi:hypothetical protein
VANLIVWPSLFERKRRVVLSAGMLACRGRVQREGEVIHLITGDLIDLSDLLRSVGERNEPVTLPHERGDEARYGSGRTTGRETGSGASHGTSTSRICGSEAGSKYRPELQVKSPRTRGRPRLVAASRAGGSATVDWTGAPGRLA